MPLLSPILTPARLLPPPPLVLVGLVLGRCVCGGGGAGVGLGLGVGEGLGPGNQIAISTRGVIIWLGGENEHNTVICPLRLPQP